MTFASFIVKSALRSKRRAALTVLSVAASLYLLVTLLVALRELTVPPEDVDSSLRIAVRNRVSLAVRLPVRQRGIIEKIPGVRAVMPLSWFGGQFGTEKGMPFAQFGCDPKVWPSIFPDRKLTPEQLEAWQEGRATCIVGRETAERYKLKIGDQFVLRGSIWPCDLELTLAGIYESSLDNTTMFFHMDYVWDATGQDGEVGTWWAMAESAEHVPGIIEKINAAFANSAAEVRAETESAFRMGFVSMLGDISFFIGSICAVVVFSLSIVTASTMSMAIRERFRELAVLKALGFRNNELFGFILAESFLLSALGGALGIGGAWLLYTNPYFLELMKKATMFRVFELSPRILGQAALVAAMLGIVSCIVPAIAACRLSVVEGLRTLD